MTLDTRLRVGWDFPPAPDGRRAGLGWLGGPDLVRQSILLILDTEPGERIMRPNFGCGLRRFLMEPNTPSTRAAIAREVDAALRAWEPRISVTEVTCRATDDPAAVSVSVSYMHVRDQRAAVLQVPFSIGVPVGGAH